MRIERQIQKFYGTWSPRVFAFSCLLLGEGAEAERTSVEAFQAYLTRGLELDLVQVPSLLFMFALDAAKKSPLTTPAEMSEVRKLQDVVVLLPWRERSVFALRGAMGLDDMLISEIVEVPLPEVGKIWMKALFRLHELLYKDGFPERKL
jgi:DNA-directed RNA polymerase specialized sigma24 family protein